MKVVFCSKILILYTVTLWCVDRSLTEAFIGMKMSDTADHQWLYVDDTYPEYSMMTSRERNVAKRCVVVREDQGDWVTHPVSCDRSTPSMCRTTPGEP